VGGSTILLIEDNPDNATIYTLCLEHSGHRVLHAADGGKGLQMAREAAPDLIVLDVSLPVLSGWEVAEALRADVATAGIPIVLCTAHDSVADRARAARLGCEAYLAKPCAPRTLVAEVEERLASRRSTSPPDAVPVVPGRRRRRAALALPLLTAASCLGLYSMRRRAARRRTSSRLGALPSLAVVGMA